MENVFEKLKVLCVSDLRFGYPMRHRYNAMIDLGASVVGIDYSGGYSRKGFYYDLKKIPYWLFRHKILSCKLPDLAHTNRRIIDAFKRQKWDILWLDKALMVSKETLLYVKKQQPSCRIVGFSHDDMMQRHNQSRQFLDHLPCYDFYFTTKSYNVEELISLGCKKCLFVSNSFDEKSHYPFDGFVEDRARVPVGFIGHWEQEREELFRFLAENDVVVSVWGGGWRKCSFSHDNLIIHDGDIVGEEYVKVLASIDIALCLLRKQNRDLQTTRSVEIPACAVFMLGERTDEHLTLFKEGIEAEFFSSRDELLRKIQFYLNNPEKRIEVARYGRERCLNSKYGNHDRLSDIFKIVFIGD